MVAANVTDVEPFAERMRKAKNYLRLAVDAAADDEKINIFTGGLVVSMEKFEEKLKVARSCVPKVAKPKGAAKAKAAGKPKAAAS